MPLAAGSIAFVGFNADGNDGIAFVAVDAIPAGTVIHFNDNEWNGSAIGSGGAFLDLNEAVTTWTSPGTAIAAGTVIEFVNTTNSAMNPRAASLGTLSGGTLALGNSDETVYAYEGTATVPNNFVAAVTNAASFAATTGTLAGTGLVAGTTALALTSSTDVGAYNAAVAGASFASRDAALTSFNNSANYVRQDASGNQDADGTSPDAPFRTSATSPLNGVTFTIGGGASAPTLVSVAADAASKEEGSSFTLTVTLSAAPTANTTVALSYAGATSDLDALPSSVTILAGATTATFTLTATEDAVFELNETVTVTASLAGTDRAVTIEIDNDDAPASSNLGGIEILAIAESLAGSVATPVATESLGLRKLANVVTGDGAGGAESIAFDPTTDRAYVTNAARDRVDILDLTNPAAPVAAGSINLVTALSGFAYGEVNSVAVRNGLVAVAVQNADGGENGVVALFDATGALIKTITVGVQPDQLTFSPDGSLILVANEAERFYDTAGTPTVDNAAGTVTITAVTANPANAAVRNTVGFTALDAFEAELDALGIKTLDATTTTVSGTTVAIADSTVSGDIEPEYIAVSPDGTRAYVTIQEANAVAVIDLTNTSATAPTKLLPLGSVDFSLSGNEADFSDRDGAAGAPSVSVGNSPVKGLLQPDAIATFSVGGLTYFVTANEGDSRILALTGGGDAALNEARASAIQPSAPADYARLNVDTVWSTPTDLYGFGGRGFSVFRENADGTIVKVDETGGDLEQIIAALLNAGTPFNSENGGEFDTRSDNKGAEPEGVTVGTVNGNPYAFLSLERIGGVMVWDLSTPADVRFVRYIPPAAGEYGPEVITFVSAADSPNGRALIMTANEVSGSVTVYEASDVTRISEVQGSGATSARVGQTVTVEAIVVGDFQNGDADAGRNLGGFFLQEEAFDSDGNPLTSEGIFVSAASLGDVALGDRVRVTGTVAESFERTQINATAVTVLQAGAVADVDTLAVALDLPTVGVQGTNGVYRADLEAYEGMLVRFPETLTITEQFNLDQFGEIRVTAGERPYSYTQTNDPSVTGFDTHLRDVAARSVIFDDGRSTSNPDLDNTVVDGDYNTATAPRMGDTVTNLTGVLDYSFSQYRVNAVESGQGVNDFVSANPRPATPPDVGGSLKVASFNVLNYFRTLDNGATTANGFEPRGAETAAEFTRQTEKLVDTLATLDADILGLIELENNFTPGASGNALEYLVAQLNLEVGSDKYDWVRPGQQFLGGDAIAVGMIYDRTEVRLTPGTSVSILDDTDPQAAALVAQSTVGGVFNGVNTSRAVLAATFEEIATGGDVTVAVNHFKSKSGTGTGADADVKDGQGNWTNQRELAATALRDWLASNPTGSADPDKIILGDLNAYAKEDAIDILVAAGFTDQARPGDYGYVFDGQRGSLDHIMTSGSLAGAVTGVADWHINSDEADALDFQLNFNADLTTNERDPSYFDAETPARVSDHDPIVLGLNLQGDSVFTLQLLHLADGEAGLLAGSTAKNLAALVDAFDDDYANTLILSGGDNFLPGPFLAAGTDPSVIPVLNTVTGSTIAANGTVPIAAVDTAIHNVLGVEVSAIGNHEFDLGSNVFAASFTPGGGWVGANYALVSANLDFSGDAALNPRFTNTVGNGTTATPLASTLKARIVPATVVEKGGEKIGIVGATTQILEAISSPTGTEVRGFPTGAGPNGEADNMALLAAQLQPIIDEMRAEGINKIIVQSHLQVLANERLLATLLQGVDIILAAGSNTRLGDANDVPIAFPGHAANFADTYPLVVTDAGGARPSSSTQTTSTPTSAA